MAAVLPHDLTHLFSTYIQIRQADKVGPLLEDKGRLARLMERPLVVLAQTRPLQT